jgi:membrane protein required for colicin V production
MIIDIVLILFAIAGFYLGYTKGIVRTLIMVVAYTVAVMLTLKISPWLMDFLTGTLHIGKVVALIFGTIAILVALIFLIHWIAKRVDASFKKGTLSGSDKILGGIIMLIVGIIFYSMLLWPINQFGMIGEKSKQTSLSYNALEAMPLKAKSLAEDLKPLFSRFWQLMEDTIREASAKEKE